MQWFRRYLGWVIPAVGWILFGANSIANWIGRSTISEDAENAANLMHNAVDWFLDLPSWGVGFFAFLLTLAYWNWLFRPLSRSAPSEHVDGGADNSSLSLDEVQFDIQFRKHVAPNQEGLLIAGGHRICAGFEIEGSDFTAENEFQIVVQVSDENGWRLYEEDWLDGTLAKGRLQDIYPLDICKSDDDRIIYTGGKQVELRVLPFGKFLTFHIEIYVDRKITIEKQFYLSHTPPRLRFEFGAEVPDFS